MIKKTNVASILKRGTAKQRSLIMAEDRILKIQGKKGLLTEGELSSLSNSIKTSIEVTQYNRVMRIGNEIQNILARSAIFSLYFDKQQALRQAYFNFLKTSETLEEAINIGISYIDPEKRKEATKIIETLTALLLSIETDSEGFIRLNPDRAEQAEDRSNYTLLFIIKSLAVEATLNISKMKAAFQLVRDYMKATDTFLEGYEISIREGEEQIAAGLEEQNIMLITEKETLRKLTEQLGFNPKKRRKIHSCGEKDSSLYIKPYSQINPDQETYKALREEFISERGIL